MGSNPKPDTCGLCSNIFRATEEDIIFMSGGSVTACKKCRRKIALISEPVLYVAKKKTHNPVLIGYESEETHLKYPEALEDDDDVDITIIAPRAR